MTTKRVVPQGKHGASGYQPPYNCRCLECRAGHAERQRNRRTMGSGSGKTVAALTRAAPSGETERAVLAEVEMMDSPPRRADVLACRNLARILDNPKLTGLHPKVTAEFVRALYVMHPRPQKRKAKRRLAAVQKMTTTNGRTTT